MSALRQKLPSAFAEKAARALSARR